MGERKKYICYSDDPNGAVVPVTKEGFECLFMAMTGGHVDEGFYYKHGDTLELKVVEMTDQEYENLPET